MRAPPPIFLDMLKKNALALAAFFVLPFLCALAAAAPKNVLVLANRNSADSMRLARDYCLARSIPEDFILAVETPDAADISRPDYDAKIARPLFDFAIQKGLVRTAGGEKAFGKALVLSTDIDYVVLCSNIPIRIRETPKPAGQKLPQAGMDIASVDSELAMLLRGGYELKGFVKNPSYGPDAVPGAYKALSLVAVARLDGPDYDSARNLYMQAAAAERDGLRGRAYIDKSLKYPAGDKWLDNAGKILSKLGYDVSEEPTPRLMSFTDRMDALAFYFGWYSSAAWGYFSDPAFRMAPGASALHIYSYSARALRYPPARGFWTPSLVETGAAAAFGNVDEPYLSGTHRPDVYCALLARGFEAGEAALCSIPVLSWKGIFLGDPLYRPFKVSLEEQLARIDRGVTDALSQYSVVRKMNLLDSSEGREAARAFGLRYLEALPENWALKWKLSRYFQDAGDDEKAISFARGALDGAKGSFSNYGLAFEILRYMDSKGLSAETVPEYEYLLDSAWEGHDKYLKDVLPKLLGRVKFPDAAKARYEAGNLKLNPPSEPKK